MRINLTDPTNRKCHTDLTDLTDFTCAASDSHTEITEITEITESCRKRQMHRCMLS